MGPAAPHDHAREQVHDDRQVEPALPRADVGDVGDPGLVGPRRGESSLQEIRDQDRWRPDRPAPRAIPMQRAKIGLAHQPGHAMLAADFARFPEIEKAPRRAVDAVTCHEGSPNQAKEAGVLLRTVRNRLLTPLVVAAWCDAENATHRLHGVPPSRGLDELIGRANSPGARLRGHWHRPSRVGMLKPLSTEPWELQRSSKFPRRLRDDKIATAYCDMDASERRLEDGLRRFLKLAGYALVKSRAREPHLDDHGGYRIIEPFRNFICVGERFDLDLEDVRGWVRNLDPLWKNHPSSRERLGELASGRSRFSRALSAQCSRHARVSGPTPCPCTASCCSTGAEHHKGPQGSIERSVF